MACFLLILTAEHDRNEGPSTNIVPDRTKSDVSGPIQQQKETKRKQSLLQKLFKRTINALLPFGT
jgi:hypothetical protein